jgi:hypothetical protein
LLKQTQTWTLSTAPAAPDSTNCPSSAWGGSEVVADRLVNRDGGLNRPVFVYGYSPAGSTNLSDTTTIQTSLFVNREPPNTRSTAQLTSAVRLRNTNRSPTAAFTVSQQNGHVVLNAANSYDPEGDGLKFQWTLDGTVVGGATNSRLDYPGLASGSSHTFTLQVTDGGGLSNQTTQTVVVQ